MIEFDGRISGAAEKHMWKKARLFGVILMYMTMAFFLPFVLILHFTVKSDFTLYILWTYILLFCFLFPLLAVLIPKSKKEKDMFATCKVFTDEEYIIALWGNGVEESRLISNAKKVIDHGEFYYIVFPAGESSESFVCQKNLLTKGTLAEFEALFEGKIVRKLF